MAEPGALRIQLLEAGAPIERFVCTAAPELERFLQKDAPRSHEEGFGRTYVLKGVLEGQDAIVGYYTLAMTHVGREVVHKRKRHGTPKQIPVALIGRLAVDDRAQGQGFGRDLLLHAFERIQDISNLIGCHAVIVDAKDERAERFYQRFDFEVLDAEATGYPRRMFLRMETVRQLVSGR